MSATAEPADVGPAVTALWRHPAFLWPLGLVGMAAVGLPLWWPPLASSLTALEFAATSWLSPQAVTGAAWFLLPAVAFGAGLLASFSPCILPLIPLNIAAIGAADASGRHAVGLSARFVLGAAGVLAVLGLAGDLAGFLLIEQRGPLLLTAGLAMLYFGLAALELVPVPFAGRSAGAGRKLGPIGAGAAFSLVTTPCASPFIGAVLAASSAQAVPGLTVASMVCFAFGYTALVFLGGIFGGALVGRLRRRSFQAPRAAAAAVLLAAGAAFLTIGIRWF